MNTLTNTYNRIYSKFDNLATSVSKSNEDKVFNLMWDYQSFLVLITDYIQAGKNNDAVFKIIVRDMYRMEAAIDALSSREKKALDARFTEATGKTANEVIDLFVQHI